MLRLSSVKLSTESGAEQSRAEQSRAQVLLHNTPDVTHPVQLKNLPQFEIEHREAFEAFETFGAFGAFETFVRLTKEKNFLSLAYRKQKSVLLSTQKFVVLVEIKSNRST